MKQSSFSSRMVAAGALVLAALLGAPAWAQGDGPAALKARHAQLRGALHDNPYGRPLHIDSSESSGALQGDVYAVLDHPFEQVRTALRQPGAWCDVMIIPFNTKSCHAQASPGPARIAVRIGRKFDQPAEQAFRIDFQFRNVAATNDYLETRLAAEEGPFGTRDYRIRVAAVPLEGGRTFLHLSYAYGYGAAGRLAMQAYLATAGADKVGFSVTGRDANGQPQYMAGVRGAVERNAMRYYLAIDAYLDALDAPAGQQVERRLQRWFGETDRYARQLREMDRASYLAMKRREIDRQHTAALD